MSTDPCLAELRNRAGRFLAQSRLRVEYYRIRRSLSYPLPVRSFHVAALPLRGFPSADYPWSIWLAWALEERIHTLGHAADATGDPAMRQAVARDLRALAGWPAFRQLGKPDLCLGHCMRTLWTAWRAWPWLGEELRRDLAAAFARAVADVLPLSTALHGGLRSSAEVLDRPEPHALLHNIPIIGTVGAAVAARAIGHPAGAEFDRRLAILFAALLDGRRLGIHEAVAYDGYVLDFMADWLAALPEAERLPFLAHPRLGDFLAQSRLLAAPGDATAVCEIGDVEPERMPFHLSAQAKLQALRWDAERAGWLARLPPAALRSDALAVLRALAPAAGLPATSRGAHDVDYAAVLRSGDEAGDLAVAMAASASPMGHIHHDNGSVVIGSGGRWLLTDPGYQQYLGTRERDFTIGPRAHNAPLIDGHQQSAKRVERPRLDAPAAGIWRMRLDLTACYPAAAGARRIERCVWLLDRTAVVVCDSLDLQRAGGLAYHWHGHAAAAWWIADGGASLCCDELPPLRLSSPQVRLDEAMLDRLPGSRGQLTLSVPLAVPAGRTRIWWLFAAGEVGTLDASGTLDGHRFDPD